MTESERKEHVDETGKADTENGIGAYVRLLLSAMQSALKSQLKNVTAWKAGQRDGNSPLYSGKIFMWRLSLKRLMNSGELDPTFAGEASPEEKDRIKRECLGAAMDYGIRTGRFIGESPTQNRRQGYQRMQPRDSWVSTVANAKASGVSPSSSGGGGLEFALDPTHEAAVVAMESWKKELDAYCKGTGEAPATA